MSLISFILSLLFFPFRLVPFSEGRKSNYDRVVSLESVSNPRNFLYQLMIFYSIMIMILLSFHEIYLLEKLEKKCNTPQPLYNTVAVIPLGQCYI